MTTHGRTKGVQRAIAAGLIAAYGLVLALASSPALHHWLHDDADDDGHHCAAVILSQGQLDRTADDPAVVTVAPVVWQELRVPRYAVRTTRLFLVVGMLEHAPPIG